ncbi:hybrid sensor histidine kinase/response regulator transcription factor [Proteiniphilum sp. UBA5384]|uniref:hybrid sensor histidine kinase/response regulator transcription factor n=1 Tax=Proteiniphilum sp. UBA5384 TaxID=1947279 RepID=UPI0025DA2880|nr:hybrid sensor histidine kinase/response regulator transcription factor [Proteiniphilum sp. UBA5384]
MRLALLFLFCFFYIIPPLHAKDKIEYYFKRLNIENGLSQNTVSCILQDYQGFMWFGTKDGLNRFDGQQFRVFNKGSAGLENDFITTLFEASNGDLWVGTDAGVYIYNPVKELFTPFDLQTAQGESIQHTVTRIEEWKDSTIWISVDYQGLFQYDYINSHLYHPVNYDIHADSLANISHFWFEGDVCWMALYGDNLYYTDDFKSRQTFKDIHGDELFKGDIITSQIQGNHNCWYVGSAKGLVEINMTTGRSRRLLNEYVRALQFNADNELWIGTETGLYIYYLDINIFIHLTDSKSADPYALSDNVIYSLFRDNEGSMWVGSYFGGINYYPYPYTYFEKYYSERNGNFGKRIREFCESNDGSVWIGTEDKGLFHFDPESGVIEPFEHPSIFHNVHGLCLDGDYLWVGTFSGNLCRIHLPTKRLKQYPKENVMSICKTSSGTLLIGTIQGLFRFNYGTDDFIPVLPLSNRNINHILEDSRGDLWVSTYANGVYQYNVRQKSWKNFCYRKNDSSSLQSDKVTSVFEDSKKRIWVLTQGGGACLYNPDGPGFTCYDSAYGFPGNTVYRMEEDTKKNLWLTTNQGLVLFNPEEDYRQIYTTEDGLLSNQFNYQSSYKDKKGCIYFGGINGFIIFDPATFTEKKGDPPIVITDLFLYNKPARVGATGSPLDKSILFTDRIVLKPVQNSFSLHVSTLGYQSISSHPLFYTLEGFNNEWHPVEKSRIINFSHLPYGTYKLRIRSDIKGSNERMLEIRVVPPVYLTGWAYFFYTLFGLVMVVTLFLFYQKKNKNKQQRLIEKIKLEKEKDLYASKINFFTNVTHEIRTPLTLIKTPLENILTSEEIPGKIKKDMEIMDMNTNRLLDLVNQLLDFRKAEIQGFQLTFENCNINDIVQDIYQRFTSLARQKKLEYVIRQTEDVYTACDREALTKIISNLLTNAIKYSATYIHLSLWSENNAFLLSIANDGEIIPPDKREEIFKPFEQYENAQMYPTLGTGIGLALARSLTELHDGSLKMDDSADQNCFILTIPIRHIQEDKAIPYTEDLILDEEVEEKQKEAGDKQKPMILLVEDNPEMLSYISRQLSSSYRILKAKNGARALDILEGQMVNLIVSDVMMPEVDGLELCMRLKTNLTFSHIPIILLTAKVTLQSKIDGLQSGADAYIEKPFSVELLKITIANLLTNREKLRHSFIHSPLVQINSMGGGEVEREFLKTITQIIDENMQDPEFNLEKLADLLHMSLSSLHRKMKGSLDMTPNDYIRLRRLKKAAQLLYEDNYRIKEVCYMVGFNTPSYFSKCFQKQFGTLPNEFMGIKEQG